MKSKNITTNTVSVFTGNAVEAEEILKRRGAAILNYQRIGANAVLGICGNLAAIAESGAYALLEYKGIGEYAEKVFDLKKSNASNYVRVGRVFLTPNKDDDTSFTCCLEAVAGTNWTATQLLELTRLAKTDEEIRKISQALVDSGNILSTMSCAEIRKRCQTFLEGPSNEEIGDSETTTENTETKKVKENSDYEKAADKSEIVQKLAKVADNVNVIAGRLTKKAWKEVQPEYKEIFDILRSLTEEV